MSKKKCSDCNEDLGYMYFLTKSGFRCLSCCSAIKTMNKLIIAKMPDIEDNPPLDGKYRSGIIAYSETMAKTLADRYYEATPSMGDWEN